MIPSDKCFDLIKGEEGLRLKAYPDPGTGGDPVTIGYGSTRYEDGSKIKLGDEITEERALKMLRLDVARRCVVLSKLIAPTRINQNQVDALLSFIYNVGIGAFEKSTLFKKAKKNPDDLSIRDEFMKWKKSGGKVMNGLVKRRQKEADLYFS